MRAKVTMKSNSVTTNEMGGLLSERGHTNATVTRSSSSRTSSRTLNTPIILNNVNLVQPWRAKKITIPLSPLRALPL